MEGTDGGIVGNRAIESAAIQWIITLVRTEGREAVDIRACGGVADSSSPPRTIEVKAYGDLLAVRICGWNDPGRGGVGRRGTSGCTQLNVAQGDQTNCGSTSAFSEADRCRTAEIPYLGRRRSAAEDHRFTVFGTKVPVIASTDCVCCHPVSPLLKIKILNILAQQDQLRRDLPLGSEQTRCSRSARFLRVAVDSHPQ